MTYVVPPRSSVASRITPQWTAKRGLLGRSAVLMALLAAPALPAQIGNPYQGDGSGVQAQTPQVITVPVPSSTPGYANSGPDWSRTAGQASGTNSATVPQENRDSTTNDRNRVLAQRPPDPPTEFQLLVNQTIGHPLPIFGSDLFSNPPSTFAPVGTAQVPADYIIGTGDEIRIAATGQLNQQGSFTVDRGGTIAIPDVGTLAVAGLRFSDLRPFLRQQIGRVYRNFELSVALGQLRSIQIYVVGQARQPGAYTVSSLATLVNALFLSGGVLPQGSLRHVELQRGGQTVSTLDLYDLLLRGDKSRDVKLQPGDVIFIPKAGPQVAITGSVTNPAIYELRGETTLDQLLLIANGLTAMANATRVRVESVSGGTARGIQNVSLPAAGSIAVHGGDIVSVDAISEQFREAVTLRGNVANPGRYGWHEGMRISDLIPDRDALLTRNYFRARNMLGQLPPNFAPASVPQPAQGRIPVSTAPGLPANGTNTGGGNAAQDTASYGSNGYGSNGYGSNGYGGNGYGYNGYGSNGYGTNGYGNNGYSNNGYGYPVNPQTGVPLTRGPATEAPTPTSANTSNSSGGGTTVGDALTQNNGTFPPSNDIILSAPDVDLAYAVVERLDPATLRTSLLPFNLGAVLDKTDPTQNIALRAGDVITIFSKADIRVPQSQQTRFVRLEGEFAGAGVYSVRPGETLRQLIQRAGGLTPEAYLYASEFTRQSTRRVEQQRLREYADSLDAQISAETNRQITSSVDPTGSTQYLTAAADNARAAVARMRNMQPTGRIVLKLAPTSSGVDSIPDLPLEDGDRFIVPRQPSAVNVAGEVYNASAFLFEPNLQVRNYLRNAGGPSRDADPKRIFVIRADGSVVSRQYTDVAKAPSLPGDTIVVPPELSRGNLLRQIAAISTVVGSLSFPLSLIALTR